MTADLHQEAEKNISKIDQRLTGHCLLSEKYERLAAISDYLLIVATILLTVSAFSPSFFTELLMLNPTTYERIVSLFSLLVLVYTITSWKADWRRKAYNHEQARSILSKLKVNGRTAINNAQNQQAIQEFLNESSATQAIITPIPENQFNLLKTKHKQKVALSKFIDQNAGLHPLAIRIKFFIRYICIFFSKPS